MRTVFTKSKYYGRLFLILTNYVEPFNKGKVMKSKTDQPRLSTTTTDPKEPELNPDRAGAKAHRHNAYHSIPWVTDHNNDSIVRGNN